MDLLVNGLFVIFGVILGWLLQFLFPSRDSKRLAAAQERLAQIEQERAEWEQQYRRLVGFAPRAQIMGYGPGAQFIMMEANEDFEAFQLDYLLDNGVCVLSQPLELLRGRQVQVPLIAEHVDQVQVMKYDPRTGTADIRLRVLVRVLGEHREVVIPARIENVLVGNVCHRRVIG